MNMILDIPDMQALQDANLLSESTRIEKSKTPPTPALVPIPMTANEPFLKQKR